MKVGYNIMEEEVVEVMQEVTDENFEEIFDEEI
jgi:hypothetical protein